MTFTHAKRDSRHKQRSQLLANPTDNCIRRDPIRADRQMSTMLFNCADAQYSDLRASCRNCLAVACSSSFESLQLSGTNERLPNVLAFFLP